MVRIALLLLLIAPANAADWIFSESRHPVKASECGGRISVNHNNAIAMPWHSFCVL